MGMSHLGHFDENNRTRSTQVGLHADAAHAPRVAGEGPALPAAFLLPLPALAAHFCGYFQLGVPPKKKCGTEKCVTKKSGTILWTKGFHDAPCWKRQWNPATCTHAPGSKGHTNTPQPSSTPCRTERNSKPRPPDRDGGTITGAPCYIQALLTASDATASRARRKPAMANLASTNWLTNGIQAGTERLRQVKRRG